jgi:hypothetical protein
LPDRGGCVHRRGAPPIPDAVIFKWALAAGSAVCATSALASGSHAITAVYSGDSLYATSTSGALSQTVNVPKQTPAVSLASSLNPSVQNTSVTFTANVTGGFGTPGELDSSMDFEAYADQIRKLRRHDGRTRDLRIMRGRASSTGGKQCPYELGEENKNNLAASPTW